MWKNWQRIFGKICLKSISAKYCKKIRNSPVRVDIEVLGQYWHHPPGAPDIQTVIIGMILWWLWYDEVVLSAAPDIQTIWWGCRWFTMFAGAQRLALTQTHCRLLTGGLVGGGTWHRQLFNLKPDGHGTHRQSLNLIVFELGHLPLAELSRDKQLCHRGCYRKVVCVGVDVTVINYEMLEYLIFLSW